MGRDDARFGLLEGAKLDAPGADLLEAHLQSDPADVDARLKLLGYLFRHSVASPEIARRRVAHIVWFIENQPRLPIFGALAGMNNAKEPGFAEAAAAWAIHIAKPDPDPNVLLRAARFFSLASTDQSKDLLERGERLRPDWPAWAYELGQLALRPVTVAVRVARSGREPARPTLDVGACRREAAVALAHFERALALCKDAEERFSCLVDAAGAALAADQSQKARNFAEEILRVAPDQTANPHRLDLVHAAHIALGRAALAEGDVSLAIDELLAAGKIGSNERAPVLRSFGPDFSLASELNERGETAAVVAYLDECARFWKPERIAVWRDQIARGEKPRLITGYDPDLP